jgi:hypothetical protein
VLDMTFDPKRLGLFFQPDPAAIAILEKSDREFGAAVGKVLAQIQDEIFECGLNGTIRRVVDGGTTLELVALIEHLRAHAFQITPEDIGRRRDGRAAGGLESESQGIPFERDRRGRASGSRTRQWPRRAGPESDMTAIAADIEAQVSLLGPPFQLQFLHSTGSTE